MALTVEAIQPRARKHQGKTVQPTTIDNHNAVIIPGKSIRIFGIYNNHINGPQKFNKLFKVGDRAEYDSYNLMYVGTIVAIGKTSVTIEDMGERKRLDLYSFCWRNWDFNLEKIERQNSIESMHI